MTSICIQCGSVKKKPFIKCKICGKDPNLDKKDLVKSLILSSNNIDDEGNSRLDKSELLRIGKKIASGESYNYDDRMVTALLKEKKRWDSDPESGLKFLLIPLAFMLLPILAIIKLLIDFFSS